MPSGQLNGLPSHRRSLSSKNPTKSQLIKSTTSLALSTRVPSHPKLASLGKKRSSTTEIELHGTSDGHPVRTPDGKDDEGFDMTFLQYCPICDKQILVPNSQILYCSEGCRQKDTLSTTPPPELKLSTRRSSLLISPISPISTTMSFSNKHFMDSPNEEEQSRLAELVTSSSLSDTETKPPELHDHKPDLDPTEWKPNSNSITSKNNTVSASNPLPSFVDLNLLMDEKEMDEEEEEKKKNATETTVQNFPSLKPEGLRRPSMIPRRESEAFNYLAKFHRSASSFISLANSERGKRASSRSASPAAILPSLGHSSRNSSNGSLSAISSVSASGSGLCLGCHITLAASTTSHEESASGFGRTSIDESVKGIGELGIGDTNGAAGAEGRLRGLLAKA